MKTTQAEWGHIRRHHLETLARVGVSLSLRDRVWAVTMGGLWVALPGTSDSPDADKWWLGCDREKLHQRKALGAILLCQAREGSLYPIGLPAGLLHDLEPRLSRNARQIFFTVARRGQRFVLQLKAGEEMDVTDRLRDVSWIPRESGVAVAVRETPAPDDDRKTADHAALGEKARFFAIVKNGALHPLDDVALEGGVIYLVETRRTEAVPGNSSLRRILARGGPADLPHDFAERHDYYAHGTVRR